MSPLPEEHVERHAHPAFAPVDLDPLRNAAAAELAEGRASPFLAGHLSRLPRGDTIHLGIPFRVGRSRPGVLDAVWLEPGGGELRLALEGPAETARYLVFLHAADIDGSGYGRLEAGLRSMEILAGQRRSTSSAMTTAPSSPCP